MRYTIVSYFDLDLEKYNPPMLIPLSKQDAIESIIDTAKKGNIPGSDKFHVYHLGSFDTANGSFELNEKPEKVADLSIYVRK